MVQLPGIDTNVLLRVPACIIVHCQHCRFEPELATVTANCFCLQGAGEGWGVFGKGV